MAEIVIKGVQKSFGAFTALHSVDLTIADREFMVLLGRYFAKLKLSTDWDSLKEAEPELLINSLSMLCPFSPEDKQALLEAPTLITRRETLVTLIEFALRGGADEEILQ